MWHVARYEPVTFFSLRPANATTAGGKTLLGPTPFAVKMALLNAAITLYGRAQAEGWFEFLRDLQVAVRLPDAMLVIATFQRVLRPMGKKKQRELFEKTGFHSPWQGNIAFREYVHFGGGVEIALCAPGDDGDVAWPQLLSQINYLGKRGSFVQFAGYYTHPVPNDAGPPLGFTWLNPPAQSRLSLGGTLQLMDDCGPEMTFAHADIYDATRLSVNRPDGRLLNTVVLPFEIVRSARGFTTYQRTSDA
jgi:hypothetical protein